MSFWYHVFTIFHWLCLLYFKLKTPFFFNIIYLVEINGCIEIFQSGWHTSLAPSSYLIQKNFNISKENDENGRGLKQGFQLREWPPHVNEWYVVPLWIIYFSQVHQHEIVFTFPIPTIRTWLQLLRYKGGKKNIFFNLLKIKKKHSSNSIKFILSILKLEIRFSHLHIVKKKKKRKRKRKRVTTQSHIPHKEITNQQDN